MIRQNVSLSDYNNFKIGGNALYFLEIFSKEELIEGLKDWKKLYPSIQEKIFVLGGGTNILFSDLGFSGLVIKNSIRGIKLSNNIVEVSGGVLISDFLNFCIENCLSGFEWAGGLPGTVGGAVRGNAGAFNGETKDNVIEVESVDLNTLETKTRSNKDCDFSYRMSIFKKAAAKEIIVSVKFKLETDEKQTIESLIQEKIDHRLRRHPLEYPNVGSIFKNVPYESFSKNLQEDLFQYIKKDPFPVIPTAKLNFLAGLSGKRVGDAMLSKKHTNFIINLGNAKAEDVKKLIQIIKDSIKEKFAITLEEEIMLV
jgi:UDP-N-acetylmuramate dehydrogenase